MGPGASVVSTGWSDQVRFSQLEGWRGGEGGDSAEFAQHIKWDLAACCEDLNMKDVWAVRSIVRIRVCCVPTGPRLRSLKKGVITLSRRSVSFFLLHLNSTSFNTKPDTNCKKGAKQISHFN